MYFGAFDTEKLTKAVAERTRQEVVYDVKEAYYRVLSLEKLLQVMEKAKVQMREHLKVAGALFEQGMVVKTDVLQADMGLATAEQNLIKTRNATKLARAGLNFLIDEDVDTEWKLADDAAQATPLAVAYAECVELALMYRPEIQQIRSKVAIDEKYVWVARADYFPSLRLFYTHKLDGGLMVKDNPDYWDQTSEDETWIAGGFMEIKLFNGGQTVNSVKEAKINLNKTKRQAHDVRRNIKLNVLAAYSKVEESLARQKAALKSEKQAAENYRITNLQYAEGIVQSINVLEAHTAFLNAETQALSAVFDYKLALAELEKAVGQESQEGEFINGSK